jgi:hypothetical protein
MEVLVGRVNGSISALFREDRPRVTDAEGPSCRIESCSKQQGAKGALELNDMTSPRVREVET